MDAFMKAIPVDNVDVMSLLNHVARERMGGTGFPNFGELSEAIARASTEDPLFPEREDGCLITAMLLVALAYCGSGFHTTLVSQNQAYGVYQIQHIPKDVTINTLLVPRDASYIAISLIRESLLKNRDRPWTERLAYFFRTGHNDGADLQKSMERMTVVERLRANRPDSWTRRLPPKS